VLPTTILITVLLAWGSIHRYARADATADQTAADPAPASATVDA
jgi:hypothetical protein